MDKEEIWDILLNIVLWPFVAVGLVLFGFWKMIWSILKGVYGHFIQFASLAIFLYLINYLYGLYNK